MDLPDRDPPSDPAPPSSLPPPHAPVNLKAQLLAAADDADQDEPPPVGRRFGDYQLLRELGRGGTGVVYHAGHAGIHPNVALKTILGGDLATASERRDFRKEAAKASKLDHPNIVKVFHVGTHVDRPFFTMELMVGGNLERALDRFREPERAAALIAKVARAVQYAHDQKILHRDLKPANILLDEKGEPHVCDFGLAKKLDSQSRNSHSGRGDGSPEYMAPEQARGEDLDFRADIFSLGVVFYELLTGEAPFRAASMAQVLLNLTHKEPVRPVRELDKSVDRSFEIVCMKCLEKNKDARYRTAAELADDLELLLDRKRPKHWSGPSLAIRTFRWVRRRMLLSAGVAVAAVLSVVVATTARAVWQAAEHELNNVLDTNGAIASGHAGAVLFQLREYADRVAAAARDPAVALLLDVPTVADPALPLKPYVAGFDSMGIQRSDGALRAQWPSPRMFIFDRIYDFRDYFRGARYLAENHIAGAYVARAYLSESKGELEFGITAPVLDPAWKGIVLGALGADSAFGEVLTEDSPQSGRITAVLGPRDNDRAAGPAAPLPSGFTFLLHPGLHHGEERALDAATASKLRETFEGAALPGRQFKLWYPPPLRLRAYRDPIPGYEGNWLAAFAPVGRTGYVVLVQTRQDPARHPTQLLADVLAKRVGVPLGAAMLLFSIVAITIGLRRRS